MQLARLLCIDWRRHLLRRLDDLVVFNRLVDLDRFGDLVALVGPAAPLRHFSGLNTQLLSFLRLPDLLGAVLPEHIRLAIRGRRVTPLRLDRSDEVLGTLEVLDCDWLVGRAGGALPSQQLVQSLLLQRIEEWLREFLRDSELMHWISLAVVRLHAAFVRFVKLDSDAARVAERLLEDKFLQGEACLLNSRVLDDGNTSRVLLSVLVEAALQRDVVYLAILLADLRQLKLRQPVVNA